VLAFVDAFIQRPEAVPDEVRAALAEHFTPAQIVELAVAMAAFLGFSKVRIALGLVPDTMDLRVVPTPDVPDAPSAPVPDRDR
jgi:alkylhydroperoxidase family enzyme